MVKLMKLKAKRVEFGLTQEDVAAKLSMSKATYARKENGICQFGADEIKQLLGLFNVTFGEIFI